MKRNVSDVQFGEQLEMFPETLSEEVRQERADSDSASYRLGSKAQKHGKELAEMSTRAPMMIRAPVEAVEGIAASGRFKTQHETGTSQGSYNPPNRETWEEGHFGRGSRPVYGHLSHGHHRDVGAYSEIKDEAGEAPTYGDSLWYGSTAFQLREHVRSDITYTHGDSLGRRITPVKPGEIDPGTRGHPLADYTEIQVHRGPQDPLTLAGDVERAIHFRTEDWDFRRRVGESDEYQKSRDTTRQKIKPLNEEGQGRVTKALKAAGVPHEVHHVRPVVEQVLPIEDWGDATYRTILDDPMQPRVWEPPQDKSWPETIVTDRWRPKTPTPQRKREVD